MSADYFLYTEVKLNDKWVCINGLIPVFSKDKKMERKLAPTYWSGSRSSFHNTYDKLLELGSYIKKSKLSDTLQEELKDYDEDNSCIIATNFNRIKSHIKDGEKENHGLIHKDMIFEYENGEIDDLYTEITHKEYEKLSVEEQKMYQYYEWNDSMGWYTYFVDLKERIKWQLYEFYDMNYVYDSLEVRIITILY